MQTWVDLRLEVNKAAHAYEQLIYLQGMSDARRVVNLLVHAITSPSAHTLTDWFTHGVEKIVDSFDSVVRAGASEGVRAQGSHESAVHAGDGAIAQPQAHGSVGAREGARGGAQTQPRTLNPGHISAWLSGTFHPRLIEEYLHDRVAAGQGSIANLPPVLRARLEAWSADLIATIQ